MVAHRKLYISHHRRRDSIPSAGAGALRGAGGRSGGDSRRSFISFSVLLLISHFRFSFSFVQRSCLRSVCNIKQFIFGFAFPFGFMFRFWFRFGFGFRFGSGFGCRSSQQALRRSSQGWDSGLPSVFCALSAALQYPFLRPYSAFPALSSSSLSLPSAVLSAPASAPAPASSASPASPSRSTSTFPSAPPVSPTLTESKTASVTSPRKTCPHKPLISIMLPRLKHETKRHGRIREHPSPRKEPPGERSIAPHRKRLRHK